VLPAAALGALADDGFTGVRLFGGDVLAVAWRVAPERLDASRLLTNDASELRLRVVRVWWPGEAEVPRTRHEDHGAVATEGALALDAPREGEIVVVAIGLAGTDGVFVAIDHARQL
jgi:hypothetical protein